MKDYTQIECFNKYIGKHMRHCYDIGYEQGRKDEKELHEGCNDVIRAFGEGILIGSMKVPKDNVPQFPLSDKCCCEKGESHEATLTAFMDRRYKNREDTDNMFGVGVSDTEFRAFIIDYLLGEDWYVEDPLGREQINEIALYEILEKYSKRYKKECKDRK